MLLGYFSEFSCHAGWRTQELKTLLLADRIMRLVIWLPLFGGAQKLNIRPAPLICGSGRSRFRILSFVSDFEVLTNYL